MKHITISHLPNAAATDDILCCALIPELYGAMKRKYSKQYINTTLGSAFIFVWLANSLFACENMLS